MGRPSSSSEPWPQCLPKAELGAEALRPHSVVGVPALPLASCVTLGKLLTSLCFSFLFCDERLMGIHYV